MRLEMEGMLKEFEVGFVEWWKKGTEKSVGDQEMSWVGAWKGGDNNRFC